MLNITRLIKPSVFGKIASYVLIPAGGILLGLTLGEKVGQYFVRKTALGQPETRARIDAQRGKIRAEMIRREADWLDERRRRLDQLLNAESGDSER